MDYSQFDLTQNPFRLTPPLYPDDIIWAGMGHLKQQIEDRLKLSMQTSMSRIIINWGVYGSGKTHAANYFTRTQRVDEIAHELSVSPAMGIKVNLPRTSSDIVQAFWRALLGQIQFHDLIEDIKKLRESLGVDGEFEQAIAANANDVIIEQLILRLAEVEDPMEVSALEAYMYGDKTKGTLAKLDLPLGLADDEQIVNLVSTVFNCLSFRKGLYSAIFLWIDEFEDIDTVSKSSSERFTTFLRQLIDKAPNNLTIFLNFTPKRFMTVEDLSVYMGDALLSRARIRIHFQEPTIEETIEYLGELLNHPTFRPKPQSDLLFPFSEDVARYVIEHIGRRSIRRINEAFSIILELAQLKNEPTITTAFIESIKEEIMSWEE